MTTHEATVSQLMHAQNTAAVCLDAMTEDRDIWANLRTEKTARIEFVAGSVETWAAGKRQLSQEVFQTMPTLDRFQVRLTTPGATWEHEKGIAYVGSEQECGSYCKRNGIARDQS